MKSSSQIHNIDPVWSPTSRILVLGSFPSVKSREAEFFYGHPQNRFWKVIASVCGEPVPATVPEKKVLLLNHDIALWDVIHSCTISGSSDSSIRDVVPNNIPDLLSRTSIQALFVNGRKAADLYARYLRDSVGMDAVYLPSTSPANAAWTLPRLEVEWGEKLSCWLVE